MRARVALAAFLSGWNALGQPSRAAQRSLDTVVLVSGAEDPCFRAPAVRARVRHWLKPGLSLPPGLRALVEVREAEPSFRITLHEEIVAERRFDVLPGTCQDRVDALALAIALALEQLAPDASENEREAQERDRGNVADQASSAEAQSAGQRGRADQPSAGAQRPSAPGASERGDAAILPVRDPAHSRFFLRAGGGIVTQAAPTPLVALGAGAELRIERGPYLGLMAFATPGGSSSLGPGHVRSQLIGCHAQACVAWPVLGLGLLACLGGAGGRVSAAGRGFPVDRTVAQGWAAAAARLGIEWPANSALALRLAADGLLNIVRPEWRYHGPPDDVLTAAPWGAAGVVELLVGL